MPAARSSHRDGGADLRQGVDGLDELPLDAEHAPGLVVGEGRLLGHPARGNQGCRAHPIQALLVIRPA